MHSVLTSFHMINPIHLHRRVFGMAAVFLVGCCGPMLGAPQAAIEVKMGENGLLRGGEPYFVKGAGGGGSLKDLAERGGNSVRTWTTNGLAEILDQAQTLGLTVSAGIWLESECDWFSYRNPEHCAKQEARVREVVMKHRNHPAMLAWGLGNEVEGDGGDVAFWKQIDRLARLVKELDPAHPTFTTVAGVNQAKVDGLKNHAPQLDFLGVNTYQAVFSLRRQLQKLGWNRPWMLTEWGARGFWESPKLPSGAPVEQTSSEKADMFRRAYKEAIFPGGGCLGSYVFVWGWKFEATSTWFGIYTHDGDLTAMADVLQEMWSQKKPGNQAPFVGKMQGVPRAAISPGSGFEAKVESNDADGDPLEWRWAVLREHTKHNGHQKIPMPEPVKQAVISPTGPRVEVKAPAQPGIYRLHVWVKDGKGHAATANMPFEVRSTK